MDNIVGLTGDDKFISHNTIDFWVRKSQAKINKDNARNVSNNFKRKSAIILSICHKMDVKFEKLDCKTQSYISQVLGSG